MQRKRDSRIKSRYRYTKKGGKNTTLHRRLYEEHYGVTLGRLDYVHHKDGDRLNNAIENLEVKRAGTHTRDHAKPRMLKPRPCAVCGRSFIPGTDGKKKQPTCGAECGAELRATVKKEMVIHVEARAAQGELYSQILKELKIKRHSFEQRRRSLKRRGII